MRNNAWNIVVKGTVAVGWGEGDKMNKKLCCWRGRDTENLINLSIGASAMLRMAVEKGPIRRKIDFLPNRLQNIS